MDLQKVISVVEQYEARLRASGIQKIRINPSRSFGGCSAEELLAHAHYLCDGVHDFVRDRGKEGKAHRHLTAIQMCLSFAGWYTLAELMEHNRPSANT